MRVTEQFASDVIITAIEAGHTYGIGYWAEILKYRHTPEPAEATIQERESPTNDGAKPKRVTLNTAAIRRGIKLLSEGKIQVNKSLLGSILASAASDDATDIDGPSADVIVQVAVLGDIVYG